MMIGGLTSDQWAYLHKKIENKRSRIIEPYGAIFGLTRTQCMKYFNVINDTFSEPLCRVEEVKDDRGYVRALFTGDGIVSHPVRYAWIPLSVIQDTVFPSMTIIFYFKIKNQISKLWNKLFVQEKPNG